MLTKTLQMSLVLSKGAHPFFFRFVISFNIRYFLTFSLNQVIFILFIRAWNYHILNIIRTSLFFLIIIINAKLCTSCHCFSSYITWLQHVTYTILNSTHISVYVFACLLTIIYDRKKSEFLLAVDHITSIVFDGTNKR